MTGSSCKVNLVNYISNIQNLNVDTELEAYAISQDPGVWEPDTLTIVLSTTNGCNWKYTEHMKEKMLGVFQQALLG